MWSFKTGGLSWQWPLKTGFTVWQICRRVGTETPPDHAVFLPFSMGDNTDVDTTSFRRSIWNYIHCMFGIRHDDYDYSEVNHLLERSLKSFIKSATCFPERVTQRDYDDFMKEFKQSEKVCGAGSAMLSSLTICREPLYLTSELTHN